MAVFEFNHERLKQARLSTGLSQIKVSKLLGLTVPSLSNWENGVRVPGFFPLVAMCELYGIKMEELVKYERH